MKMKLLGLCALIFGVMFSVGCYRTYDTPEYQMVDNNETAFVIPLVGDTSKQAKLESAEQLEHFKVATKRIQITHIWSQTGRFDHEGEWVPDIRLIKVNRTPVAREWVSESKGDPKGNGLWLESSDSIAFSTGFTVVANVDEVDTALFLYKCKGDQLSNVMDTIIRARVQAASSQIASKYTLDELRSRKNELVQAVKDDIVPYMKTMGVTVSSVGLINGMTYENGKIQEAIDSVFVAQQEKNTASAALSAVKDKNLALIQLGQGEAQKVREIAKGMSDAAITKAEGERRAAILAAEGEAAKIDLVTAALAKAQSNPLYFKIKELEVQRAGYERWNGSVPAFSMGGAGGTSPAMILNMAMPSIANQPKPQPQQ